MAASSIKNPSVEICSLPYPLQGVLTGGQTIIFPYTPAQIASVVPSLADAFIVTDLGDYDGPTDEADYGPVTGTAQTFERLTLSASNGTSGTRTMLTVAGSADTGVTASMEQTDVYLNLGRTVTWATGALTNQRAVHIDAPTYAFAAASTITNAATLYVSAAPTASTNATITNNYAFWVDAGMTRLDGGLTLSGSTGFYGAAAAAQPAAVADAAGGATVDAEARTAINTLLARLRVIGLIAT